MESINQEINKKINNAQINLIQNTRFYTVSLMFAVALFVYYMMLDYVLIQLDYWIIYIFIVDIYRIFMAYKYSQDKHSDTVNYSNTYRHIRYGDELYDLKNNPDELRNLANEQEYAEIKEQLSQKLNQWIKNHKDTFYSLKTTNRSGEVFD